MYYLSTVVNASRFTWLFILLSVSLLAACVPIAPVDPEVNSKPQNESSSVGLADLSKNEVGYVDITVDQLVNGMSQKDFTLVNVHVPFAGNIPDTDLSIPFDDIQQLENALPEKTSPIVLYCRSGNMSTQTAQMLVDLGYTNLYELDGGMNAWQSAGHELLLNR